jgi:hypothetical protein
MSIVERILPVFDRNYATEKRDVIWDMCMKDALKTVINEHNLENMCCTSLVSGFGGGGGVPEIVRMAEALGIAGVSNPENDAAYGHHFPSPTNVEKLTTDEILDKIQAALPFQISFPDFYGNCYVGTTTKYGVTSNRHIFYLWILKRIMELCPDRNSSIIEIGAGFGILGYYLHGIGYRDYTAIDLAMVNACQTYFLSRNIPDRNIILSGDVENPFDPEHKDSIKLLHATDFKDVPKNRFSIMVNMDGLTEYGIEAATKYVQSDCAPILLSINHEVNTFRVIDIEQPHRKLKSRYPFWLRAGYVEEVYAP